MSGVGEVPPVAPSAGASAMASGAASKVKEVASKAKESLPSAGTVRSSGFKEHLEELQAWDQPFNSASAVATATTLYNLTAGADGYSPINLVCYVLIFRTVVVAAFRSALAGVKPDDNNNASNASGSFLEKWVVMLESWLVIPSPSRVSDVVDGVSTLVETKVNRVCQVLAEATEPTTEGHRMLKVVLAHLAATIVVFSMFSLWTLMYLYFMYQMIWPALYSREKERIDDMSAKIWVKAEPFVSKAKTKLEEVKVVVENKLVEIFAKVKAKVVEKVNKYKAVKTDDPAGNKTE